jgi:hypothetical protein
MRVSWKVGNESGRGGVIMAMERGEKGPAPLVSHPPFLLPLTFVAVGVLSTTVAGCHSTGSPHARMTDGARRALCVCEMMGEGEGMV